MKHRVLIITTVSGFLWQFEKNSVEILKKAGAESHYASNFQHPAYEFDPSYFEKNGIRIHHIPIEKLPWKLGRNFRALVRLAAIIRRENIDTVHCHNPVGGLLGRLAARLSGRRPAVIYTAHGFHFYQGAPARNWLLYYTAERFLARCTDVLITINKEDEECARRFRLKRGGNVFRIPGTGVDTRRYMPRPWLREEARRRMGVKKDEFCLLTAALLDPEKNHETVLRMLAGLEEKTELPIRYVICGDGPHRRVLEELTRKWGLEDQVIFLGFCTDLEVLLQGADVFLFPSLREGLGMAALEAMACGVPVVAARNRGTVEYVRNGENGFLCEGRSPEDFRDAVLLLQSEPALREAAARRAAGDSLAFGSGRTEKAVEQIYRMIWREREDECEGKRDHERVQSPSFFPSGKGGGIHPGSDMEGLGAADLQ